VSTYSLRVTVDGAFKQELDQLKSLLAHKIPNGDLGAVLREAVQCALEKHGKRKGAVEPSRKKKNPEPKKESNSGEGRRRAARDHIPAEVRRAVWKRDGGRCAWRSADGRVCGSTWKLEIDHIEPVALGGGSRLDDLRLACFNHNQFHADQTFGRAHMEKFRHKRPRAGGPTIASGSGGAGVDGAAPDLPGVR
jgi:hypothetical protein